MSDSPRRELHADVTYALVGFVFGFLLMNESSRSPWSRVPRAERARTAVAPRARARVDPGHARGARAFDGSRMDFE